MLNGDSSIPNFCDKSRQSINTSFPTVILIAKTFSGLNPKHPRILFNKELKNLIKKSAPFTTPNKLFDKSNEQENQRKKL